MKLTFACILIGDAMRRAGIASMRTQSTAGHAPEGVFVVDDASGNGMTALNTIIERLDYRMVILDASRTNLNDLEIAGSPLYERVHFACRSEKTYVFVLRGWVPAMADDPRLSTFRSLCGSHDGTGLAVILSDTSDGIPAGFVACDLRDVWA